MLKKIKIFLIFLVLLLILIILIKLLEKKPVNYSEKVFKNTNNLETKTFRTFYEGTSFYDNALVSGEKQKKYFVEQVLAGITPHHLIVADKIAAFFLGLTDEKIDSVILLSPDHFNSNKEDITVLDIDWQTPYGIIRNDQVISAEIVSYSDSFSYSSDDNFEKEHGINYLLPFIKKIFPEIKVTSILINKKASKQSLDKLSEAINSAVKNKKVLVVGSIDFSHDAPAEVADQRDIISNEVISLLDLDNYQKISADCPQIAYVIMKYVKDKQARPELLWHTNSSRLTGKPEIDGVSHNFYYFLKK
ncbi:MAG TPA: AmmeMemoRadiSam system protein B [Candidatus Saccharimonadales bacterium]|nr:AmmeMemoRadiSam system protein B [Candidatus Saccharimonadales bacterium]